jgi:hypothetical protein
MSFMRSFVFGAIVCCAVVFAMGSLIEPVSGDLTRLGAVAERSWGWNIPQTKPAVRSRLATDQTSILVIGDSFSDPNIWQSVLENELGRFTQSYSWNADRNFGCIKEKLREISKQTPQVKDLILEVVEREFVSRFTDLTLPAACSAFEITSPSVRAAAPKLASHRPTFALQLQDPIYAFKATYGEMRDYARLTSTGDAVITPLLTDRFFSNKRSAWLLYYADDLKKNSWQASQVSDAIKNLKELSDDASSLGIRLMVVLIPDKSSVYAQYVDGPALPIIQYPLWQLFAQAGLASVNLKDLYTNALPSQLDIYLPNDTHLGFNGYNLLAKAIAGKFQSQMLVQKNSE